MSARLPEAPQAVPSGTWHLQDTAAVLSALGSSTDGLSEVDATRRLADVGPNQLAVAPPTPALTILVAQFRGVVTLLLVVAAAVSLALGEHVDAAAIGVVIALNAALGFVVELRARRAMEALLELGASRATVIRDGRVQTVDAATLVPGDVVELAAGQTVPADGRLIDETELRTNEAALTGESLPVNKTVDAATDPETPLAERTCMVYRGTTVAGGVGVAVITATGDATEVGRIGRLTRSIADEPTPLERRLDALGRRLVWLALGVAALVAVLGVLRGASWSLMFETAIALAVAAVPEGLPAVATIALAVGLRRMAARHALVRRLSAVESLGSTTVVCTDKTRTLTTGDMAIVQVWTHGTSLALDPNRGERADISTALETALELGVRASRPSPEPSADDAAGAPDPVDRAFLSAAAAAGVDVASPRLTAAEARTPFSSERRYSAAFFRDVGGPVTAVKGAPETVLAMCTRMRLPGATAPLTPERRDEILRMNQDMAGRGLRVLALARGSRQADEALDALEFIALAGLMDPPAPGVRDTIARLRAAGLRTVMLTGDQKHTAEAIGRQLGLLAGPDAVIDGRSLRGGGLDSTLHQLAAVSRITAEDKLTVVSALQDAGEVVAMLGDGVNDAPALRKADVGVAMGMRGTDVAREAAAIVLQDDRFETIAAAVEEGRVIGDNIRKFVFYLFSCNLAEILVLLLAEVAALPQPLLPLQILWLNLVTDTFPALALAVEPGDRDVMARLPRDPGEALLSGRFLGRVLFYAGTITLATLGAMVWALGRDGTDARTVAFMTLALAQIFHLGNARSERDVVHPAAALSNPWALAALAGAIVLQTLPLLIPRLGQVLSVAGLDLQAWVVVLAASGVTALVGQAIRLLTEKSEPAS